MGALNTMREIGVTVGFAVLAADIAKGLVAILIAQWLGLSLIWVFVVGFAAVAGHNWPIFVGFRGGKGAATTMGVLLALSPREFARRYYGKNRVTEVKQPVEKAGSLSL